MAVARLGYEIDSSGAVVAEQNLDDMAAAAKRAEVGSKRLTGGAGAAGKAIIGVTFNARMLVPQLSQIGQQFTATGQLGQAIAVQAADIGLAFGVVGTVIGTVAGVALPSLIDAFSDGESAASEFEGRMDALSTIMERVDGVSSVLEKTIFELAQEYGDAAIRTREFALAQAELAQAQSASRLADQFSILRDELDKYSVTLDEVSGPGAMASVELQRNALSAIQRDFRVTAEQAAVLRDGLNSLAEANTFELQQDALSSFLDTLTELGIPLKQIPEELQVAVDEMITLGRENDAVSNALRNLGVQTKDWASDMAGVRMEIDAIGLSLSSIGGGMVANAAKAAEIQALRAGKSIKEAATESVRLRKEAEFEARESGANFFEKLLIQGERYQFERGLQLDIELDRERKAARERDQAAGGAKPFDIGVSDIEKTIENLRTQQEIVDQWYAQSQEALKLASDAELAIIGGRNEAEQRLQAEHVRRLAAINAGYQGSALDQAQTFFGDMASALQGGNSKMIAAAQTFASIEALINAYRAYNQVIADPTLPWFAKIPAAAGVLAAGLRTVSSIKSLGGGGSSGTSATAGVTASSPTTAPQQTRAIISLQGGRSRFTVEEINDITRQLQEQSDDGVIIEGFTRA